MISPDNC